MKNQLVIGVIIVFFAVFPFQNVKASSEFDTILQLVSAGNYEESVKHLHGWFTHIEAADQEALLMSFENVIADLSSEELSSEDKLVNVWSFIAAAEYETSNSTDYLRFMTAQLDRLWLLDKGTGSKLTEMKQIYEAMTPALQLVLAENDLKTMRALAEPVSSQLFIGTDKIPVFEQWIQKQSVGADVVTVSIVTGSVVIISLTYASWRKYVGEKRRKRIRNHND
ncbi:sporulation protein YpjB [Jeotgalibacillus proteolyticus]|uniref:Sporulation protein YpjB n=1 Tax=Jeotgalibacillus proteolyticus TaxID=2082395 RepID=A0A2S5GEB2_9BACL|nr:sporulation protein YpjB [Jeotgalibacillus proteolyticus]PPA71251.1 hypothetical protein C4B60_04080 [Jeotgalibacillus proteolyticus]